MWHRSSIVAAGLLALAMSADAAAFTDTESSPFEAAITALEDAGIVSGYGDGTFRPEFAINRAELLEILIRARFPDRAADIDLRCFRDLEVHTPQWYAYSVCFAQRLGIVQGYPDGTFRPERTVSLAEALKMSMRTFGITPTLSLSGQWYEPYLREARTRGILLSLLSSPAHLLTRGEMAAIVAALHASVPTATSGSPTCGNGVQETGEQCDDGNAVDGDGCSSICVIVPEPVRIAILQITQQTTGSIATIARGQRGVPLLKFTATAGRQDALLTGLTFTPTVGSLAFGEAYALAMDRDGDGTYETPADVRMDVSGFILQATFMGGLPLPKNVPVPFVLSADLPASHGPMTLGLSFATDRPDYVEAQGAEDGLLLEGIETNGVCTASNCFIRVDTSALRQIDVVERGNLFVTMDTAPARSSIFLIGTVTGPLLRLRLRATGEDMELTALRIDGVPGSIENILLYRQNALQDADPGSLQPIAQATASQCATPQSGAACVRFGVSTLTVAKDQEAVLLLGARLKPKTLGGLSGQPFTLTVTDSASAATHAIDARGASSKSALLQNDGDGVAEGEIFIGTASPGSGSPISGRAQTTAFAAIDRIDRSGPEEQPFVPTGQSVIGSFTVHALPHANGTAEAALESLSFTVTAQNVQTDPASARIRPRNDTESWRSCSTTGSTNTFTVTCSDLNRDFFGTIPQGQERTYELLMNIVNPEVTPGWSAIGAQLTPLGSPAVDSAVHWTDGTTSFTWVATEASQVNGTVYRSR